MIIRIVKVEDDTLSQSKYEIYLDKKFYVGNLTKTGLKYWKQKLVNKGYQFN